MSAYTEQTTQITDADILKKCLAEKGYTEDKIEHHSTAQPLVDFQGHQTKYVDKNGDKAEIIIRRRHVGGAANDIGFKKQADGTYSAIISQFDKHKHNDAWMADLKKRYAEKKIKKTASQHGMTFVKKIETPNGGFKLQFVAS